MFDCLTVSIEPYVLSRSKALELSVSLEVDGNRYRHTQILERDPFERDFDRAMDIARHEILNLVKKQRES